MNLLDAIKTHGNQYNGAEVTQADLAAIKAAPAKKFKSQKGNDYFSTTMFWQEDGKTYSMRLLCQAEGQTLQEGMLVSVSEYESGKWSARVE